MPNAWQFHTYYTPTMHFSSHLDAINRNDTVDKTCDMLQEYSCVPVHARACPYVCIRTDLPVAAGFVSAVLATALERDSRRCVMENLRALRLRLPLSRVSPLGSPGGWWFVNRRTSTMFKSATKTKRLYQLKMSRLSNEQQKKYNTVLYVFC